MWRRVTTNAKIKDPSICWSYSFSMFNSLRKMQKNYGRRGINWTLRDYLLDRQDVGQQHDDWWPGRVSNYAFIIHSAPTVISLRMLIGAVGCKLRQRVATPLHAVVVLKGVLCIKRWLQSWYMKIPANSKVNTRWVPRQPSAFERHGSVDCCAEVREYFDTQGCEAKLRDVDSLRH